MRYKVPRHVDYKAKIVGPATFSQLLYIAVAGFFVLLLYFLIGDTAAFVPIAIVIGAGGAALAFAQVSGQPLPEYIKKMIIFSTSSREYIWEKKIVPMESAIPKRTAPNSKKEKKEDNEDENNKSQKRKRGNLGNIAGQIETY